MGKAFWASMHVCDGPRSCNYSQNCLHSLAFPRNQDPQKMTPYDFDDHMTFHSVTSRPFPPPFLWNISTSNRYTGTKFGTDIHVPHWVNCTNYGDLLTFHHGTIIMSKFHLKYQSTTAYSFTELLHVARRKIRQQSTSADIFWRSLERFRHASHHTSISLNRYASILTI